MSEPSDIMPTPALERAWDDLMDLVVEDPEFYNEVFLKIKPFEITRLFKIAQDAQEAVNSGTGST